MARAFALYWPADSTYRVPGRSVAKSFTLALEGVNTFITPCLSFVLVWGILKRRPFRHALQLTIATYSAARISAGSGMKAALEPRSRLRALDHP